MTFKITLEASYNEYVQAEFMVENLYAGTCYKGTLYDYNQIQFLSKTGGVAQFMQDYLQFEEPEAVHIATQLENWQQFINSKNKKE